VKSLRNLVRVMPRDWRDHIVWLVKRGRYEEVLTAVEELEAEENPSWPKRTQFECKRLGRRILSTLFTKVVSSNNDIIISSCTSPMLRGYERQGINSWLEKLEGFWSTQQSRRESVCQCGWNKDQGDYNVLRSQSHPSTRMSIGVIPLQIRTFAFGFTCLASYRRGGNDTS